MRDIQKGTKCAKTTVNNTLIASSNVAYRSDGHTTVDVGGAIERVEADTVPEPGNPWTSRSEKATLMVF